MAKTRNLELLCSTLKTIANILGVKLAPLYEAKDFVDKEVIITKLIECEDGYRFYHIGTISNGFVNNYYLIHTKEHTQLVLVRAIPLFALSELVKILSKHFNIEFTLVRGGQLPAINYYSTFLSKGQYYDLEAKFAMDANLLTFVEYYGLDEDQRAIHQSLGLQNKLYDISPILHTSKQLKMVKTGRCPEKYFYESDGEYFPREQSEEVSTRYRYHDDFIATESWNTNKHVSYVALDSAPEPIANVYNKVWDNSLKKYIRGQLIGQVKLTKEIQQNLVRTESSSNLAIFDVDNIKITLPNVEGELLFPVKHIPVSYAEHNRRYRETLNELNIWLNDNLGESFTENVYTSIEQYLQFNSIAAVSNIGRLQAILRCLRIRQYALLNQAYLCELEIKSTSYIVLFRLVNGGVELIYAVPYRNHSSFYNNYSNTDEGLDEVKTKMNAERRRLDAESEMYNEYLVKSPRIKSALVKIIKKELN